MSLKIGLQDTGELYASSGAESKDVEPAALDPTAEKRVLRKIDLHIMPLAMLIYIFSFLDRVNIGNARLYGLEEDLGLHGNQYQILVSILFATYISVELPSNWVIKRIRPSRWIAFITTSWGIVATLAGVTQNFGGMLACRILLGAFEGGMWPGLVTYLTMFYTRREIALRIAVLFACSALAGACGGLFAFAIGYLDGHGGYHGWRWILIIEGLPTIVFGILTWFIFADDPSSAYYLSEDERALVQTRLDQQPGMTASAKQFHWADVLEAFYDWKIWVFCFAQFGADVMLYAFSTFLPTIIKGISADFSTAIVQVLTIPCYMLGAVTYLVVGYLSDRSQRRGIFVVTLGTISVCGYGMLISNGGVAVHYAGCFLVAGGLYVMVGLPLAWLPTNIPRYGKRTTTIAMQAAIGNSAGIMASFLYPSNEGPRYIKGHAISLAMGAFGVISFGTVWAYYLYENTQRRSGRREALVDGRTEEDLKELGDKSPRFIFVT
ncbi:major facilitator superfamily domain-containing protein [Aspergillus pseudoustus]|uniref:Major facilitator superfamily domain-containing protein n=1 Tax=Aspergillus pseudoustus TaxID=1810923 RepID=A0ABR4J6G1_9EURO